MKKIDKHYVSNIDKQLKAFDETQEKTASVQAEFDKHQRIYRLRDHPTPSPEKQTDLWE